MKSDTKISVPSQKQMLWFTPERDVTVTQSHDSLWRHQTDPISINTRLPCFLPVSFLPTGRSTSPPCWTYEGWCGRRSARRSSTSSKTLNAAMPSCAGTTPSSPTSPSPRRCTASAWVSSASPWPSPTGSQSTVRGETAGQVPETQRLNLLRARIWKTWINFTERTSCWYLC